MDPLLVNNRYGVLADFTLGPEVFGPNMDVEVREGGEDLAAKLTFKDRVIKVGWDGRIEVEPNGPA